MGQPDDQIRNLQAQIQGLKELLADESRAKSSMESMLQLQVQKHEEFTDRVPWIVAQVDSQLRYNSVNRVFEQLQGIRQEDVFGRPIGECGESPSWSDVVHDFASQLNDIEHQAMFDLETPEGPRSFLAMMSRSEADNNITIIAFDQTERLHSLRDVELYAQRAVAASEAKSHFLGVISHELRTPLNGILGMATLLEDSSLTNAQQDMANTIRASGQNLESIVNDILDFANVESGRLEIQTVPFCLRELIDELLQQFQAQAQAKGLYLKTTLEPDVPLAPIGDPARIRQVLVNLVDNAVKFTEEGGVSIRCTSGSTLQDEWQLSFEVSDTGPGIPADQMDRIFSSFVRGDDSTTRRFGGIGLGLSIAQQLVQAMGGELEAESASSHGTCFRFAVPSKEPDHPQDPDSELCSAKADEPSPAEMIPLTALQARELHVLVAEDNRVNQKVAEGSLKRLGCRVTCVENGQLAIEAALDQAFDLILMDVEMPELDGLEATRELRNRFMDPDRHLPIVALTANAIRGARETCLEAGMDDYMSKPMSMGRLEEILRLWCS